MAEVVDDRLDEPPRVRPRGRMPVAIPADIEDRSLPKASGMITLPGHIAWSPPYEYDLDDRRDLRGAYARVMTEGLDADVRYYIDVDTLVEPRRPVGAGNSAVVVDLPRCGPMLSPRESNLVPILVPGWSAKPLVSAHDRIMGTHRPQTHRHRHHRRQRLKVEDPAAGTA